MNDHHRDSNWEEISTAFDDEPVVGDAVVPPRDREGLTRLQSLLRDPTPAPIGLLADQVARALDATAPASTPAEGSAPPSAPVVSLDTARSRRMRAISLAAASVVLVAGAALGIRLLGSAPDGTADRAGSDARASTKTTAGADATVAAPEAATALGGVAADEARPGAGTVTPDLGAFEDDRSLAAALATAASSESFGGQRSADASATTTAALPGSPAGGCPATSPDEQRVATATVQGRAVEIAVTAAGTEVIDLTTCDRRPLAPAG